MKRANGVLMPIFSLPSSHGIGTFGKEAYRFVDFLQKAGQSYWQILPLNPTNYGDSPYQSFSSFAGNPYFIDLDCLEEQGLLTKEEIEAADFGDDELTIDYGKLYENRLPLLRLAFERFAEDKAYRAFCRENAWWLEEYALFMALKNAHDDRAWETWEEPLRLRKKTALAAAKKEHAQTIAFYRFVQYLFTTQWQALKAYANDRGIRIIGDIPIYVAYDSADTWANTAQFLLDETLHPTKVSGCPPDAFAADGQLWGNPLYNWKAMKEDDYAWWKRRLGYALKLYDIVRIDHFRGFESFYAIPAGQTTAKGGKWMKGPDMALFRAFRKEFGNDLPIIAEDLGYLTPAVKKLLASTGFPGMKVLQFAFDSREDSDYLPHNYPHNCVVYTGTHDNDTIIGWTSTAYPQDVESAKRYLRPPADEGFHWTMMRAAMMSTADTCILMMNDLIAADSSCRINVPSTLGGNWVWRIDGVCINDWLAGLLREETAIYGRL